MELPKDKNDAIAICILKNIASEAQSRMLQQELLSLLEDSEDIYHVMEISGDETNHSIMYEAMYKKYSGVTAAPDGMKNALAILAEGLKGGNE